MSRAATSSRLLTTCGILIGFLGIGAMDGWPFGSDLETTKAPAGLFEQDVVVLLLLFVLVLLSGRRGFRGLLDSTPTRVITFWALVLLGWWTYTVLRTWLDTAVPVRHAIYFGRFFAYFPLLTVFMADVLRDRRLREWALGTFVLLALLDGVLQTAVALGLQSLQGVVHSAVLTTADGDVAAPGTSLAAGGFIRVYASSADAVLVALFVCLAVALLDSRVRRRRWAMLGALVAAASILAEVTRAKYLGAGAGMIAGGVIWFAPRGDHRHRGALGAAGLVVAIAGIVALVLAAGPGILGDAGRHIGSRVGSSLSTALRPGRAGTTTQAREQELTALLQIVGRHATLGLGFLDPRDVFFAQTRGGSIENSDLGLFNAVATMGVIGTVIYYLGIVGVPLAIVVEHARGRLALDDQWVGLAVLGWSVAAIVSSLTLVTLFSSTGVVSAGLVLGCGGALLADRPRPTSSSAPRSVREPPADPGVDAARRHAVFRASSPAAR